MRKFLLISMLALLAGTGLAAAQIVDDPPGSLYQDQGNREWLGGSVHRERSRSTVSNAAAISSAYSYLPDRAPVRRHMIVNRKRGE